MTTAWTTRSRRRWSFWRKSSKDGKYQNSADREKKQSALAEMGPAASIDRRAEEGAGAPQSLCSCRDPAGDGERAEWKTVRRGIRL